MVGIEDRESRLQHLDGMVMAMGHGGGRRILVQGLLLGAMMCHEHLTTLSECNKPQLLRLGNSTTQETYGE